MLGIFKPTPDTPDADITVARMLADIVIKGSPVTVLDRLVEIVDTVGPFGGLLIAKKDWDDRAAHLKSYRLMAEDRKSTRLNPVTNAHLVCRLLLEKTKTTNTASHSHKNTNDI